jgi:membrane fusion protein, multidrug efflux system
MNRSVLIAGSVAIAAIAWVVSGQFKEGDVASVEEMKTATGTPATAKQVLPQVRTRLSIARDHQSALLLFGRTEGVRSVQIRLETAGRITAIPAKKGQAVKKGDVIARIAMADRMARLKEEQAKVHRFAIAYEAAQKLSKKQFRSKVQLAESLSNLETAKSALRSIRVDIERATIRAPFDGILNDILVDIGDYVAVGDVSASVVDLDPILVVGDATERVASNLTVGDRATVKPVGGSDHEGIVTYVSKVGSSTTRTFRVEISLANPGGVIAEGVTAELKLDLGTLKAHFLTPAVLTLSDSGELGVKVVDGDNVVRFHPVQLIDDTPDGLWLTGLPDQAELIVVGQEFVQSGQKVEGVRFEGEPAS